MTLHVCFQHWVLPLQLRQSRGHCRTQSDNIKSSFSPMWNQVR